MKRQRNDQQGQALVIMAFAVIALAALVGLAIDGGRLYALRRQAQNAADAAAMAGTRELASLIANCEPGTAAQSAVVVEKVLEFGRLNQVDEYDPNGDLTAWYVNGSGDELGYVLTTQAIPTGAAGVRVSTRMTDTTTFMRLFGQRNIFGVGKATGMTGPIKQFGGGLLPIAVPEVVVNNLDPGEVFRMKDDTGEFCRVYDDYCYVDTENPPMAQRGWLNLSHIFNQTYQWDESKPLNRVFTGNMGVDGCKYVDGIVDARQTGLKGWASDECPYPYDVYAGDPDTLGGDFIAGETGGSNSGMLQIDASYGVGDIVVLPVFDYIYEGDCDPEENNCMTKFFGSKADPTEGINWFTGTSQYYYHIIGFVAVRLTDISPTGGDKGLEGALVNMVIGAAQINPGAGIRNGVCTGKDLVGLSLWE